MPYSSEICKYNRIQQKYGSEPKSYEELQKLINETLAPTKRSWHHRKPKESCNYGGRPVQAFTVDGQFVGEYGSISEASEATGVFSSQILKCLKKTAESAKGFIFIDPSDQDSTSAQ